MALSFFPDYPQSAFGNKRVVVVDLTGPAAPAGYVAIVQGSPPTGGQAVVALDVGLTSIEYAECSGSDNGQYTGVIFPGVALPNGKGFTSVRVMWLTAATGAEVAPGTPLNARGLRLLLVGI